MEADGDLVLQELDRILSPDSKGGKDSIALLNPFASSIG
jgi:hypothetical protein